MAGRLPSGCGPMLRSRLAPIPAAFTRYLTSVGTSYPGSSQLTTGGKTYTFTVSDKKCSHSSTVLKYMIPLDCTHKGYTGITVCSDCGCVVRTGYELDPMGHSWQEGTVTKEAVNSENGCISFGCHLDVSPLRKRLKHLHF